MRSACSNVKTLCIESARPKASNPAPTLALVAGTVTVTIVCVPPVRCQSANCLSSSAGSPPSRRIFRKAPAFVRPWPNGPAGRALRGFGERFARPGQFGQHRQAHTGRAQVPGVAPGVRKLALLFFGRQPEQAVMDVRALFQRVDHIGDHRAGGGQFARALAVKDDVAKHVAPHEHGVENIVHPGELVSCGMSIGSTPAATPPPGSSRYQAMSLTAQSRRSAAWISATVIARMPRVGILSG